MYALPRVPEPDPGLLTAWREQDRALQDIYGECGEDAPIGCPGDVFALVKRTLAELRATAARVPEPDLNWRELARTLLLKALPVSEKHGHCWCDGPDNPGLARHKDTCPARILQRFDEAMRAARAGAEAPPPEEP